MVNIGSEASDFFQSDASLRQAKLRQLKQGNTLGSPVELPAKVLSVRHFASPLLEPIASPYLLVGDAGHTCRVVVADTGKAVAVFRGHSGPVTCTQFYHDAAADDTFIFTGSWDKTVKQWSLKTRECVATWALHADFVKSLALAPNRAFLCSGSSDKLIRVLDLATGTSVALKGHIRGVEDLIITPDCKTLWSCGSEGAIRRWNLETKACDLVLSGHETSVYAMYLDLDDELLWSASADKSVKRWPLANKEIKAESSFEHDDYVKAVLPVHSSVVLTGSRDEAIRVWDMASEKLLKVIDGHYDEVSALCIVGDTLYSGSLDCTIRSWKLNEVIDPKIQFKLEISLEEESLEQKQNASGLTADEERELAELMSDDDE
ncbi:hypothetical protein H9P43_001185 [Blastocladiella emersonii ATCC 22665]|nr:hypothetical protein H9P43_001185 [Blastocladiella emersonii ATCC 22665]